MSPWVLAATAVVFAASAVAAMARPDPDGSRSRTGRSPGSLAVFRAATARREGERVARALPPFLEEVARAVRGGQSMAFALEAGTAHAHGPLILDLDRIRARLDRGTSLPSALHEWMEHRAEVRAVQITGVAVSFAASAGGSVAQAIDSVADTIRSELAIQAEVEAMASQARASAVLVAMLPVFFASVGALTEPDAVSFFLATPLGLVSLGGGLALDLLGWAWMRRITGRLGT